MRRVNESLETYKNLTVTRSRLAQKEIESMNEKAAVNERFKDQYHTIMDMRNRKESTRSALMEAARNDALSTIVKAIYIGALEASTLTDSGIILAESMVDSWIKENGGASNILRKSANKTYLLSRITQIVEEVAEETVKEIEEVESDEISKDNKKAVAVAAAKEFLKDASAEDIKDFMGQVMSKEEETKVEDIPESEATPVEEPKEDEEEVKLPASDEEPKTEESSEEKSEDKEASEEKPEDEEAPIEEPKSEESKEDDEKEEVVIDKDDEDEEDPETSFEDDPETEDDNKDDKDDDEDDHEDDDDDDHKDDDEDDEDDDDHEDGDEPSKDEIEDHTDEELGEPLDDDGIDQDTTIDGHTDNDGKIFDDLNKEEDVQKAVELIRSRIADAEETFIRNNAEDKKKIDELLNKISTNVKTIEDLSDKDETKTKIAEESVRVYKRHIDSIKENRPLTVFEKMSRNLSRNIIKDEVVRESYITESGTLDTDLIVESAKVMYGFLETINTLQFEKVDSAYIKKVLDSMN